MSHSHIETAKQFGKAALSREVFVPVNDRNFTAWLSETQIPDADLADYCRAWHEGFSGARRDYLRSAVIVRNHRGWEYPKYLSALEYAVQSFGFIMEFNSSVSISQFADMIDQYCCNPKAQFITNEMRRALH